nr:MAG TPA: hypothetical protein [Caudoviricetes sp.]
MHLLRAVKTSIGLFWGRFRYSLGWCNILFMILLNMS